MGSFSSRVGRQVGDYLRSRRKALLATAVLGLGMLVGPSTVLGQPTPTPTARSRDDLVRILKLVDERQHSQGDSRANLYIEAKEKGKVKTVYNALVFRRSADGKFMILFTNPKSAQGQGYLRVDKNLWFYDPAIGKWERRTERERIGGTNSRRSDYDEPRFAEEFDPEDGGEEKLGAYLTHVMTLRGKPKLDQAFPVVKLWIDTKTMNVLKRQDFALSGRLLRTLYFPKWSKAFSDSKKSEVWYAEETRIFDEVEKENSALILVKGLDVKPLDTNLFTKAWLESKSR